MKIFKKFKQKHKKGFLTIALLGMIVVFAILMVSIVEFMTLNSRTVARNITSQKAFNIAEAGTNYYLWHLAHNPTDFKDGKTTPATPDAQLGYGPYVHDYYDDDGTKQGTFTLWIKPQGSGSTIATVRSIGKVNNSNITRTIDAQIGSPSFASYALVSDGAVWFGSTGAANGPVHSNVGVRMDAPNSGDVTSANTTYVPGTSLGGTTNSSSHPGVWCNAGVDCASRNATDNNGTWRYPVPSIDFNSVTAELCSLKKKAFLADASTASIAGTPTACQNVSASRTASYVPRYQTTFSATRGYLIELNTDNTYNLYRVANETYSYTSSTNYTYRWQDALNETLVQSNIAIPQDGIIFVEDNVWVRTNPTFGGRVTITSGRLASTSEQTNVFIADDLKYTSKNGQDAIGLIAEDSVIVAPYAPPRPGDPDSSFPFEIDAAVIAKEGRVGITSTYGSGSQDVPYWNDIDKKLVYYGSISVRDVSAWLISGGGDYDGFGYRETNFDYNLLYAPPPFFPITGSYNILSWHEVLTAP